MPFTVAQLAELVAGAAEGDTTRIITGANTIENAGERDLAFAAGRKALDAAPDFAQADHADPSRIARK